MKFFPSPIISVAPPVRESTITLPVRIATRTNEATNSCKVCSPENTRVCATALSDVLGAPRGRALPLTAVTAQITIIG